MNHAPFVDLQVNGYAGVDFTGDDLTVEGMVHACQRLRQDGVHVILATVISDNVPVMCRRIAAIAAAHEASTLVADVVLGIHIEGPFLNEQTGYRGAHPERAMRLADEGLMQQLLDAGGGLVRLVTLAPERDPGQRVIRQLARQGIRIAAGHCDASTDQLRAAIDAGLSLFTHLGNGCPLWLHRHDNIIQRVLALADRLWISFIADGVHVPFVALRNYLKCTGLERAFVVTDAIAAAGLGPGTYMLAGESVVVDEQLATWSADRTHLRGAATTMRTVVDRLQNDLGLAARQIEQLTRANPLAALGEAP